MGIAAKYVSGSASVQAGLLACCCTRNKWRLAELRRQPLASMWFSYLKTANCA